MDNSDNIKKIQDILDKMDDILDGNVKEEPLEAIEGVRDDLWSLMDRMKKEVI